MRIDRQPNSNFSNEREPDKLGELLELTGGEDRTELERAIRGLKADVADAPKTGRTLRVRFGEFCIPIASKEHKERLLSNLSVLDIYPWEDSGVLYVEHHRDLEKLRLANVIDDRIYSLPAQNMGVPPELAFPLPHIEGLDPLSKVATFSKNGASPQDIRSREVREDAERGLQESDEEGADTEIADIVAQFDRGLVDEQDDVFVRIVGGTMPSMRLFPRRYLYEGGVHKDIRTGEEVSAEAKEQLIQAAKAKDDKAFRELASMYRGLVLSIMLRVKAKFGGDPDDLFQEGMLGLVRAIEKYEKVDDASLGHYARSHIEARMRRFAFEHRLPVRLPAHVSGERKRVYALRDQMRRAEAGHGTYVGPDDLELTNLERTYLMGAVFDPVSDEEDNPIDSDTSAPTQRALHDESVQGVPRGTFDTELKRELKEVLSRLTPREERIIRLRFGLPKNLEDSRNIDAAQESEQEGGLSLDKVAEIIGRSREQVRQIEARALIKMKHPRRNAGLVQLLNFLEGRD